MCRTQTVEERNQKHVVFEFLNGRYIVDANGILDTFVPHSRSAWKTDNLDTRAFTVDFTAFADVGLDWTQDGTGVYHVETGRTITPTNATQTPLPSYMNLPTPEWDRALGVQGVSLKEAAIICGRLLFGPPGGRLHICGCTTSGVQELAQFMQESCNRTRQHVVIQVDEDAPFQDNALVFTHVDSINVAALHLERGAWLRKVWWAWMASTFVTSTDVVNTSSEIFCPM